MIILKLLIVFVLLYFILEIRYRPRIDITYEKDVVLWYNIRDKFGDFKQRDFVILFNLKKK